MSASIIKFQDNHNANSSDQDFDFNLDQFAGNTQEENSESSTNMFQEGWIISYVDIITLLLTLFIILLAMSNFNSNKTPTSEYNISAIETEQKNTHPAQSLVDSNLTALVKQKTDNSIELNPDNATVEPHPRNKLASQSDSGTTTIAVESSISKPEVTKAADERMLSEDPDPLVDILPEHTGNEYLRIDSVKLFNSQIDASKILPVTSIHADVNTDNESKNPAQTIIAPDDIMADNTGQITSHAINARSAFIQQIGNSALGNKVEVAEIQDHVNLVISDDMLFPLGSAELKPEGMELLQQLADMIKSTNLNISVEGHTDNVPINNVQFPSNWELSTARATLVTRLMIENAIEPSRIRAVGYADTHPRASNETAQGRERNRRVTILLHVPEAATSEETLAKLQASAD